MHLNHYENPYSRLAQYMSCAGAPIWCTAQAMPTTSDQYTLLTLTIGEYFGLKTNKESCMPIQTRSIDD